MPYQFLGQLYYSDKAQYDELYQARFNSSDAIRLDFFIGAEQAFLLQTPDLLKQIIRIQKIDKQVQEIIHGLPKVAIIWFRNRCLVDEIVLTNNIEGVHSTRREIDTILETLDTPNKRNRFFGLVQKYWMLSQKDTLPLNSCEDIRNIYDELVLDEISREDPANIPDGKIFRKDPVSIKNPAQKEIHTGLYPEEKIVAAMEKALSVLADDSIETLFRIGIFHYLFGYIHPFYEGNGRTSRFISSYLLSREFEPVLGYRISYTIKENISEYYNAFKLCNDPRNKGDLTPFLMMFLDIIEKSIVQLYEALEKRLVKLDHYYEAIGSLPGNNEKQITDLYFYLIQASLFSGEGISTKDLLKLLEISRSTLAKRLQVVSDAGLLLCQKQSKEKYYRLDLEKADQIYSVME